MNSIVARMLQRLFVKGELTMRIVRTQPSVAATLLASLLFACPTVHASAEEESGLSSRTSAPANIAFRTTLPYSLLATESLTIPEEVELKWVDPTGPHSVSRLDERRALRGRLLLATGLPPFVLGAILTGFTRPGQDDDCYLSNDTLRTSTAAGLSMLVAGAGLSIGGIIALHRAPKPARAAPKTRKARGVLAAAALGSIALSAGIFGVGIGDLVGCWSS